MSGKGSGRRPTDEEKYKSNWDTIFGKKVKEVEQQELFKEQTNDMPSKAEDSNLG